MPAVRRGFRDLNYHYEKTAITLNGSGAGTTAVTFDTAYQTTPVGVIVPPLGSNGTWSLASLTTTGFTLTCTGDTVNASKTIEVVYFTHENL